MTGDTEGPEWFGDDPVATGPDPAEGTDQNWFEGRAFQPTPTGEAPDPDHDLGTYRPSEPADGAELDLSVTSSLQAGIGSGNGGETDTESDTSPAKSGESAPVETSGSGGPGADGPAEDIDDSTGSDDQSGGEQATDDSVGLLARLRTLFGL